MSGGERPEGAGAAEGSRSKVSGGVIVAGVLVLLLVVGGIFLLIGLTQGDVANPGGTPGEESSSLPSPVAPARVG